MKLAVAVLSSILLAFSVTTASPVKPSKTTSTESSTSTFIPSTSGIGIGNLDPLPRNVKYLLKEYAEIQDDCDLQRKVHQFLKSQYDSQREVIMIYEKKLETLKKKPRRKGGDPEHDEKIQKIKSNLKAQYSKFIKLDQEIQGCESEFGRLTQKEWKNDHHSVRLVFGTPLNLAKVLDQVSLIRETPSAKKYLEEQSDGQRKRKDLESSDEESDEESDDASDEESGPGSSKQKVPSKKRKGFPSL
ncbi:hypothetical protein BDEG_24493 [Batrachochytrium dendrobatidis JEL423]|uniref:Uncharacterized protein n=1 Tax=Batrachochytrium dendrobatidis (strain JEL423) TaxID=403673 RepID=A0A177WLU0_BATDL|nr:hypothetical protein BDEG_24493 [Batrachochytrium dendrobatidis JEL423]